MKGGIHDVKQQRDFLKTMSVLGAAAAMPASIERALAVPTRRVTGRIKDVKHVVILMQENRSFDHYFGTMGCKGIRGPAYCAAAWRPECLRAEKCLANAVAIPSRYGEDECNQGAGHAA